MMWGNILHPKVVFFVERFVVQVFILEHPLW